jgi:hypothetical protein
MSPRPSDPPTYAAYFQNLERHLRPLPRRIRRSIVAELARHVDQGTTRDTPASAVLARLGPAPQVARTLATGWFEGIERQHSRRDVAWLAARAALIPCLFVFVLYALLLELESMRAYAPIFASGGVPARQMVWLLLLNLPAIIMVVAPMTGFFGGMWGLLTLARTSSESRYRRLAPRFVTFAALAALGGACGLFTFQNLVVAPANRATVDFVRAKVLHLPPAYLQDRTPQELSYGELASRIDQAWQPRPTNGDARAEEAAKRVDGERMSLNLKIAFPALGFTLTLLGLAFGALCARLRWPPILCALLGLVVALAPFATLSWLLPSLGVVGWGLLPVGAAAAIALLVARLGFVQRIA